MDLFQPNQVRILVVNDGQAALTLYENGLSAEQKENHKIFLESEEVTEELFENDSTCTLALRFDFILSHRGDEVIAAVEKALEENQPFAVVFLDVRIAPNSNGIWMIEHIRARDPAVEIVIVTGDLDVETRDLIHRVPPLHKLLYIQKPFYPHEIYRLACTLGSKWHMEHELRRVHEELEGWIMERWTEERAELLNANTQLKKEIVERQRVEEALRKSEERHRIVLEAAPDPVIVYNMEEKVTYLNPAFSRVFGWVLKECEGQDIDFVPIEHFPETRLIFTKINHGETISGIETCRLTKDGKRVDVSISGAGFFDSQGNLQGSVITLQDISDRKNAEKEIKFIAYHDTLTGLPNRRSFYIRLEDELVQSRNWTIERRRRTERQQWALLFLDLDRFKFVNETLGHDVGDELLKTVADRLRHCLRKSDYIFRLGGDEFTIILSDLPIDTDVARVAQKIRAEIAQPYYLRDYKLYVTVSIGISVYPHDGKEVEVLVKNADMAMYAAKGSTEGYRFFTEEMNRKALERMKLESSLHNALQENQFILYYQPLVDNRDQITGMEALLRWHHPQLGLVKPDLFIPLAEETGAIVPIGAWVLSCACQQMKKWQERGYTGLYVAVNLSTRQFREPDLVETIERILETTGLSPKFLKLEVTESGIMENPEDAIVKMKILRARGIRFSIDDFGTGYSSLSYLKRFPIDTLKIDRSFVVDSLTNRDDQEIIKMIIAMARNLGIETLAEGVETKEQQEFLRRQGCNLMQGYYFGHPMSAGKFEEMCLHCVS